MKINFEQALHDIEGEPLKVGEKVMTLRTAATMALMVPLEAERNLEPQKKFERYALAVTIQRAMKPISLKSDDITLLKQLIGKAFGPAVVGVTWPLLDPAEKISDRAVEEEKAK